MDTERKAGVYPLYLAALFLSLSDGASLARRRCSPITPAHTRVLQKEGRAVTRVAPRLPQRTRPRVRLAHGSVGQAAGGAALSDRLFRLRWCAFADNEALCKAGPALPALAGSSHLRDGCPRKGRAGGPASSHGRGPWSSRRSGARPRCGSGVHNVRYPLRRTIGSRPWSTGGAAGGPSCARSTAWHCGRSSARIIRGLAPGRRTRSLKKEGRRPSCASAARGPRHQHTLRHRWRHVPRITALAESPGLVACSCRTLALEGAAGGRSSIQDRSAPPTALPPRRARGLDGHDSGHRSALAFAHHLLVGPLAR